MENTMNSDGLAKLKVLVTVVNRGKGNFFIDMLENYEVNFQTMMLGRGTANSDVLNMLGLDGSGKDIVVSIIKEDDTKQIFEMLNDKFSNSKKLQGIAFTAPVKSTVGVFLYQFLSDTRTKRS